MHPRLLPKIRCRPWQLPRGSFNNAGNVAATIHSALAQSTELSTFSCVFRAVNVPSTSLPRSNTADLTSAMSQVEATELVSGLYMPPASACTGGPSTRTLHLHLPACRPHTPRPPALHACRDADPSARRAPAAMPPCRDASLDAHPPPPHRGARPRRPAFMDTARGGCRASTRTPRPHARSASWRAASTPASCPALHA